MDFLDLIRARYSVRSYDARPVPQELLLQVLEAGRVAPTAKNMQPQRIYVLQSEEALAKIRAITPCAFDAPIVLMLCGDTTEGWKKVVTGEDRTETDVAIVTTHLMLAAAELGLGTCWVGNFETAKVQKAFDLPAHIFPYELMPLGYPAKDAQPSERHTLRKPLADTVRYL